MDGHGAARRKTRRESAGALLLSAVFHLLFFVAVFATASGVVPEGSADPFSEGEAIEVSLAGAGGATSRAGSARSVAAADQAPSLDLIARRLRAERSDLLVGKAEPSASTGSLSQLFETIGRIRAPVRRGEGSSSSAAGGARDATTERAGRIGMPVSDDGAGGLWGQVEPCWRRLPQRSGVPVTLEVVLNDRGGLAAPPRILRPTVSRPDEARLVAEAQALTAIQACLPYRAAMPGGSNRVFRLAFGGAK